MKVGNGVSAVFSASHRDPLNGALHGHDYKVTAFWSGEPMRRFECLQTTLSETLRVWDHTELPPELWSAEAIGKAVMQLLGCEKVLVERPLLGHIVEIVV